MRFVKSYIIRASERMPLDGVTFYKQTRAWANNPPHLVFLFISPVVQATPSCDIACSAALAGSQALSFNNVFNQYGHLFHLGEELTVPPMQGLQGFCLIGCQLPFGRARHASDTSKLTPGFRLPSVADVVVKPLTQWLGVQPSRLRCFKLNTKQLGGTLYHMVRGCEQSVQQPLRVEPAGNLSRHRVLHGSSTPEEAVHDARVVGLFYVGGERGDRLINKAPNSTAGKRKLPGVTDLPTPYLDLRLKLFLIDPQPLLV